MGFPVKAKEKDLGKRTFTITALYPTDISSIGKLAGQSQGRETNRPALIQNHKLNL